MNRPAVTSRRTGAKLPIAAATDEGRIWGDDRLDLIEARFQAALAVIKRERRFSLDPWASKACVDDECRIGNPGGSRARDHGLTGKVRLGV